jgi:hypothetical protein
MSQKALARRAERGSLRVLVKNGKRHVPTSELMRSGLLDHEGNPKASNEGNQTPRGNHEGFAVLLERLEKLVAENAALRQIEAQTGTLEKELAVERESRERAEAALFEARAKLIEREARRPWWKRLSQGRATPSQAVDRAAS